MRIDRISVARPPNGWVVIEFGNPDCPGLGWVPRAIEVPASGYVCTSSSLDQTWSVTTYWRAVPGEPETPIAPDRLHLPGEYSAQRGACHLRAYAFWFGEKSEIRGHPAETLMARHPECGSV